ncbi:MAG: hypothetical protein Q7K57_01395, partial [Burkholderiaceae bacterium]|nr:hypothetical protein [Burkholderiaceae bacterium]
TDQSLRSDANDRWGRASFGPLTHTGHYSQRGWQLIRAIFQHGTKRSLSPSPYLESLKLNFLFFQLKCGKIPSS